MWGSQFSSLAIITISVIKVRIDSLFGMLCYRIRRNDNSK